MVGINQIPRWLEALLHEKFFKPCLLHEFEKRCERNAYCLNCCIGLCPHCLPLHQNHTLLQIRRYVYQDVVRLSDAENVIDCSSVQPYTTNSAKVLFINPKPMIRQVRGSGNTCVVCHRSLQDPYLFCSLSCKVHHWGSNVAASITNNCITQNSIFELPILQRDSSVISSSSSSSSDTNFPKRALDCTTTEFTKKRRSPPSVCRNKCRSKCVIVAKFSEVFNRRKGVPHRSPLY